MRCAPLSLFPARRKELAGEAPACAELPIVAKVPVMELYLKSDSTYDWK